MISIIMPVYNKENYLDISISSYLRQSFEDFELIVVDDGSTDNSLEICQKYERKDSRVTVFHTENHGVCAARNFGFNKSHGNYILFSDSDDEVEPDMLAVLYGSIIRDDSDIAMCGLKQIFINGYIRYVYGTDSQILLTDSKAIMSAFFDENLFGISICTKLFKKEIINDISFEEGKRLHEDKFFLFSALNKASRISINDSCLYNYYERKNSAATKKMDDSIYDIEYFANKMRKFPYKEGIVKKKAEANYIKTVLEVIRFIYSTSSDRYYTYAKKIKKNIRINKVCSCMQELGFLRIGEILLLKISCDFYGTCARLYTSIRTEKRSKTTN